MRFVTNCLHSSLDMRLQRAGAPACGIRLRSHGCGLHHHHGRGGRTHPGLGKPVTVTEEASCAFDGTEKTYCYEHFCLTTCPVDGAEIICRVWFTDDSLSTAEGIRVGSSRDAVAQAYGGDVFKDDGLCVLNRGESSLTILLTNGAVTSVQYALIIK